MPEITVVHNGKATPLGAPETGGSLALRLPPMDGRDAVPQIVTFNSLWTSPARTYYNPDQAVLTSVEDAFSMRNDLQIMTHLESRQRMTALLPWHLQVDGSGDKYKDLVNELTWIINRIPLFTDFRTSLQDAIWYGRAAVQYPWSWVETPNGHRRLVPGDCSSDSLLPWTPINGDKLIFKYDNGRPGGLWTSVGIRVPSAAGWGDVLLPEDFVKRVEPTQWGMGYFLNPQERQLLTIHKHIIEDGQYERPWRAGAIHGVGIRDRIYQTWFQKQAAMRQLIDIIERVGSGVRIYYFPAHDPEGKKAAEKAAMENRQQTALVVPRDGSGQDLFGVDFVEPNSSGIDNLQRIVHEFFGHQILRYILGQTLSSEAEATGMGSGVAELQGQTLRLIVEYDAKKQDECLTGLVNRIKDFNFPDCRGVHVRFVSDLESDDVEKKLGAIERAWNMGLEIKKAEVYGLLGTEKPTAADEVLPPPPSLAQPPMQMPGQPPASPLADSMMADTEQRLRTALKGVA